MPPKPAPTPPPVPDTAESRTGNPAPTSTPSFSIIDGSNAVTFSLSVHRHTSFASSDAASTSATSSVMPSNSFVSSRSRSTAQDSATNIRRPAANTVSPAGGTLSTGLSRPAPSTDSSPARPGNGITDIRSTVQDGATPIRQAAPNAGGPSLSTPDADRGIGIQETTATMHGAAAASRTTTRTLYSLCEPYYTRPAPERGPSGMNGGSYPRRQPTEEEAELARLNALIPHMPAHEVYTFGDCPFGRSRAAVGPQGAGITDITPSRHRPDPVGMFGNAPSMRRPMWQDHPQEFDTFQEGGFVRHSRAVQPPAPTIAHRGLGMGNYPPNRNIDWTGDFFSPPRGNRNYTDHGIPRPPAGFIPMLNPPLGFYGFPYASDTTLSAVRTQQTVNPPPNFGGFPYAPGVTHGVATAFQAHAATRGAPTHRPLAAGRPGVPSPTDTAVAPPPAYTYSGAFPLTINLHPSSTILETVISAADPNVPLTYDDFFHTIAARIRLPRFWIQPQGGFVVRFNTEAARRLVGNEELPMVDVWDVDAMELNLVAVGREEWERQLEAWRAEGRGRWPMGISRWEEEGAE